MEHVVHREALAALAEWGRCWCEVWDYTVSHGVLRVKLGRKGESACAVLVLKNCSEVAFSSSWESSCISVQATGAAEQGRYLVSDAEHLQVECGAVLVTPTLASYAEIPEHWYG
jgi:hypothetical protein